MFLLTVLAAATISLAAAQPDAVPANHASWVVPKELPEGAKLRLGSGGIVLQHTRYGRSLAQISPDGRLLAVAIDPQVCVVRERVTGKELYRLKAPRTILDGNAFSILQFAPDSKTLAFGTTSRLQIVDAANGENRKTIPIPGRIEFSLTFSGNGKRFTAPIITTTKKFRREIWDVATAKPLPITPAETDRRDPWRIALSADGKTAALFSYSSKVEIGRIVVFWDVDADKEIGRIDLADSKLLDSPNQSIEQVAFSPDDSTLAIWAQRTDPDNPDIDDRDRPPNRPGQVLLYDAKTRRERFLLIPVGEGYPSRLEFSPDGQRLVAATQFAVSAWRTASGQPIPLARRSGGDVRGIAFAGADILVLAWNGDLLNWWDAVTGRPGFVSSGPRYAVRNLAFTDTKTLLSVTWDGAAIEWDRATGKILKQRYIGKRPASENGFWREGTTVLSVEGMRAAVAGSFGGDIEGFDGTSNRRLFKVVMGPNTVGRTYSSNVRMSFAPHEDKLIVAVGKGFLLFDANTGALDAKVAWDEKSEQTADAIELSPDLKQVAVVLTSESTPSLFGQSPTPLRPFLFDAATGKLQHEFPKSPWADRIAFSPNAKLLAISDKGEIRLHRAATGALERTLKFKEPGWIATALCFSPDGKTLAVGTMPPRFEDVFRESALERFDVADGESLQQTPVRHNRITNLAFAPDGRTLATAGQDETILIWPIGQP